MCISTLSTAMPKLNNLLSLITRAAAAVAFLSLCIQIYTRTILQDTQANNLESQQLSSFTHNGTEDLAPLPTIWDLIRNEDRISRFADILNKLPRERSMTASPEGQYTVFAPLNEAFQKETFGWDLPDFYWLFLVQYHMSMQAYSLKDLAITETIPTMIWADIYQTNPQRMSTQVSSVGTLKCSHRSSIIEPDLVSMICLPCGY